MSLRGPRAAGSGMARRLRCALVPLFMVKEKHCVQVCNVMGVAIRKIIQEFVSGSMLNSGEVFWPQLASDSKVGISLD